MPTNTTGGHERDYPGITHLFQQPSHLPTTHMLISCDPSVFSELSFFCDFVVLNSCFFLFSGVVSLF